MFRHLIWFHVIEDQRHLPLLHGRGGGLVDIQMWASRQTKTDNSIDRTPMKSTGNQIESWLTGRRCRWRGSLSPLPLIGQEPTGPLWSAQGGCLPQILLGTGSSTALPHSRTGKYVYYPQIEQQNQFCLTTCPHSPNNVADLSPSQVPLLWGTVLISEAGVKDMEPHLSAYILNLLLHIENNAMPVSRLKNIVMWPQARDQTILLWARWGYKARSLWANICDGTTQLCIIKVIWTSWEPLGLESFPSESANGETNIILKKDECDDNYK